MKYRTLGKTGLKISEVSLGTWQLGGKWGDPFSTQDAQDTLAAAYDAGVNFFDTADVYQDGQSEHAIGQFRKTHDDIIISTKIGRKLPEQTAAGYSPDNIRQWIDDCLTNQGVDALDNVLLHCPSFDTYYTPETFFTLDQLQKEGKIKNYGVSVEKVEQAIKALDYNIGSVEIIFNMFRLRPAKLFFELPSSTTSASLPGCRWLRACCLVNTPWIPSSVPTINGRRIVTGSNSTRVRPSPVSTTPPA